MVSKQLEFHKIRIYKISKLQIIPEILKTLIQTIKQQIIKIDIIVNTR